MQRVRAENLLRALAARAASHERCRRFATVEARLDKGAHANVYLVRALQLLRRLGGGRGRRAAEQQRTDRFEPLEDPPELGGLHRVPGLEASRVEHAHDDLASLVLEGPPLAANVHLLAPLHVELRIEAVAKEAALHVDEKPDGGKLDERETRRLEGLYGEEADRREDDRAPWLAHVLGRRDVPALVRRRDGRLEELCGEEHAPRVDDEPVPLATSLRH